MKEKIEKKIEAIVEYIISKPEDQITADDYMIIASEVRDIRFRENEAANQERMERMLALGGFGAADPGRITKIHPVDCA